MSDFIETAEYWEAVRGGDKCSYENDDQRRAWAAGAAFAWRDHRDGKRWYRSRTMLAGIGMLLFGIIMMLAGETGFGGGLTAGGVLSTALRLITKEPVNLGQKP
jgi:hypothetical protein